MFQPKANVRTYRQGGIIPPRPPNPPAPNFATNTPNARRLPMNPPSAIPPHLNVNGNMPPPPSTNYVTAPEYPEGDDEVEPTQHEEEPNAGAAGGSQDPFDHLYGRLVPCNPALEAFDLCRAKPTVYIGRNPNNDYVLLAPKISARHCEIRLLFDPDGKESVSISDLSSNGTFVAGHRIGKGRHLRLNHGDEVCLGIPVSTLDHDDFRFIFRLSSQPITTGAGIHQHYQLGELLGSGSFAIVKRCYSKLTRDIFACKILAKSRLKHNPKQKEYFERELAILQTLRHHNITRLVEYFEDEATIFIVMEFCGGGDLLGWIQAHGPVPEEQARVWSRQMMDALSYTHRKGISHRDLKPENVLLTSGPSPTIKIADFGLAKQVTGGTFLHTMCGTPQYLAPEVVIGGPGSGYDSKVDAYSLGVIIWCMMTNVTCFGQEDENVSWQTRMAQRRVEWNILRQLGASELCEDFLRRLIVHDPKQRMSVHDALNHEWIVGIANPIPEGFVGSQQSQSSRSQDSQRWSDQLEREGTAEPELGEPVQESTTDPYNFEPVVNKDADGNERWEARDRPEQFSTASAPSEEMDLGDGETTTAKHSSGLVRMGSSGVLGMDDEMVVASQVAEMRLLEGGEGDGEGEGEDMTSVGTPPPLPRRRKDVSSEMSWEQIGDSQQPQHHQHQQQESALGLKLHGFGEEMRVQVPIPSPTNVQSASASSSDERMVKPTPKTRRALNVNTNLNRASTPKPKRGSAATPTTANTTTKAKRKMRDMDFDSDLSDAISSADEGPVTTVGGKALDAGNPSFSTTSSNDTIRGGRKTPSPITATANGHHQEPAPPATNGRTRRSTAGGVAASARASARLRDRTTATPATTRRVSGETERKKVAARVLRPRSASPPSESDDDDGDISSYRAGPSKNNNVYANGNTRKGVATPAVPARRNVRNGVAAAKVARIR